MKKKLASLLVCCFVALAGTGLTLACGGCGDGEDDAPKVEFFEGYLEEVSYGESIQVRDYIPQEILDYKKDGKKGYTFKMQFGDEVYDLTNRATFAPDAIGEWKMILTIGDETVEATLNVKGRMLTWASHIKPTLEFDIADESKDLDLVATLEDMGIEVFSDVEYETYISSVLVGSVNPTRIDLKGQTSYTFEVMDIHIFEYKTVAVDGQVLSGNFYAVPKTTETKGYVKKDDNYPFRDWYGGTNCSTEVLLPQLATDGFYVTGIHYFYMEDQDWCGIRANDAVFKKYFDRGITEFKMDVYNMDDIDHTYRVFHHLKEEYLPEGSVGTLKAGKWTTITVTKEMLYEAFALGEEAYAMANHGVYGWTRKSWSTRSNFPFTVGFYNSAYDPNTPGEKITFYLDNLRVYDKNDAEIKVKLLPDIEEIPLPDKVASYWGNDNNTSPFRVSYIGTEVRGGEGFDLATDGILADKIIYQYNETNAFAGLRGNDNVYANYYRGWNGKTKLTNITFDIYNTDTVDHTYTLFHHLKEENRPEGSTGTLKAGEWTTITITREMLDKAYAPAAGTSNMEKLTAAYESTKDGVYETYTQSWNTCSIYAFTLAMNISNYDNLTDGDTVVFYLDNLKMLLQDGTTVPVGA